MQLAAVLAVTAATFTIYPGVKAQNPAIEAMIDRGPIVELIVRCPSGTAIISYSKMERRYCGPDLVCDRSMATVVRRACR